MANQFLVEIHEYISRQIDAGIKNIADARSRRDQDRMVFMEGKIDELKIIRTFLSDHFNLSTQKYY
jgi:hypothetical protein